MPALAAVASVSLSAGTDSAVRAASSICLAKGLCRAGGTFLGFRIALPEHVVAEGDADGMKHGAGPFRVIEAFEFFKRPSAW